MQGNDLSASKKKERSAQKLKEQEDSAAKLKESEP